VTRLCETRTTHRTRDDSVAWDAIFGDFSGGFSETPKGNFF